jgi:hypothetical protein
LDRNQINGEHAPITGGHWSKLGRHWRRRRDDDDDPPPAPADIRPILPVLDGSLATAA